MPAKRPAATDPELVLILGAARSGTTLLRSLLDAHPAIGSPAEAGLPALIGHARRVWATVCASDDPNPTDPLMLVPPNTGAPPPPLPAHAEAAIRQSALTIMRYYCRHEGKTIYCDKSLDSGQHLAAVYRSFPRTKVIIVVRHVMDTIASGVEASPWGFGAYGYTPFVYASPENTVLALARYWEAHVSTALRWQEAHGGTCHPLKYEDLVTHPTAVLADLFRFLEVDPDMGVLQRAFERYSPHSGPGDYKLGFTRFIDPSSIGLGKRVPVGMIPPPLLDRINELFGQLGYQRLTSTWNAEPKPVRSASVATRRELAELMATMTGGEWPYDADRLAILADDDAELRWVLQPRTGTLLRGDGDVDVVITGAAEDLAKLLRNETNIGLLTRSGRIRQVRDGEHSQLSIETAKMLQCIVSRLGVCSGHATIAAQPNGTPSIPTEAPALGARSTPTT
jgi:hypothetical protein